jgi:hypothetical protein
MDTSQKKDQAVAIRDLAAIATSAELGHFVRELAALQRFATSPSFRLSVLGRPSVNKAGCINRLLDRALLPTGLLSMDNVRAIIREGDEQAVLEFADGTCTELSPAGIDWETFRGLHLAKASFRLQDAWVKKNEICIRVYENLDDPGELALEAANTPKAGGATGDGQSDINTKKAPPAESARTATDDDFTLCDGALLIVDATAPLGLPEMHALDRLLVRTRVPRMALVVTKLALVAGDDWEKVLQYIRDRLRSLPGDIGIFILDEDPREDLAHEEGTDPMSSSGEAAHPMSAMKETLERWADSDARAFLREKAVSAQLLLSIDKIETALIFKKLDLARKGEGRREQLLQMRDRLAQKRLIWKGIRIGMEKRSVDCVTWWKNMWDRQMESVKDKLKHELSLSRNPKGWWEKELGYRLKTELTGFARGIERPLEARVLADIGWAVNQLREEFARSLNSGGPQAMVETPDAAMPISAKHLSDISRPRDILKVVTGAAAVAGYIFFGPLGLLVTVTGGILNDRMLAARIADQGRSLSVSLDSAVARLFDQLLDATARNIREFYDSLSTEIRKQEGGWVREQEDGLSRQENLQDPEWESIAALIGSLESIRAIV